MNLLEMAFGSLKLNTTLEANMGVLRDYQAMKNRKLYSRTDDTHAMYDGYRLYWVLHKYLNMLKFPHGRMSEANFEICSQTAMIWLFGSGISHINTKEQHTANNRPNPSDHLERLLSFNSELTFDLLVQLFEPDIAAAVGRVSEYKK